MAKSASTPSSSGISSALIPAAEGIRLRVRVKPGSSRHAVVGRTLLAGGQSAVLIAVSVPPEGGRANAAVLALLAKSLGIPKTGISVRFGAGGRTKILEIAAGGDTLSVRLSSWLLALPEV